MKTRLTLIAVFGSLAVAGCDSVPTGSPAATLTTTPAALRVCDPPTKVTVSWSAKAAANGVKLYALGADDREVLFVESASQEGTAETGDWAAAETKFVLKDRDSKKELARFAIGSEQCM